MARLESNEPTITWLDPQDTDDKTGVVRAGWCTTNAGVRVFASYAVTDDLIATTERRHAAERVMVAKWLDENAKVH